MLQPLNDEQQCLLFSKLVDQLCRKKLAEMRESGSSENSNKSDGLSESKSKVKALPKARAPTQVSTIFLFFCPNLFNFASYLNLI